jgi:hypothetical protein
MAGAHHQTLRILDGRFVLHRAADIPAGTPDADILASVRGPDGGAAMVRDDAAGDAWVALWNGDDAHDPDATGMCSAIVGPLAADGIPVWVAASYDGDLVLVPADQLARVAETLRQAGHRVTGGAATA